MIQRDWFDIGNIFKKLKYVSSVDPLEQHVHTSVDIPTCIKAVSWRSTMAVYSVKTPRNSVMFLSFWPRQNTCQNATYSTALSHSQTHLWPPHITLANSWRSCHISQLFIQPKSWNPFIFYSPTHCENKENIVIIFGALPYKTPNGIVTFSRTVFCQNYEIFVVFLSIISCTNVDYLAQIPCYSTVSKSWPPLPIS